MTSLRPDPGTAALKHLEANPIILHGGIIRELTALPFLNCRRLYHWPSGQARTPHRQPQQGSVQSVPSDASIAKVVVNTACGGGTLNKLGGCRWWCARDDDARHTGAAKEIAPLTAYETAVRSARGG